MIHTKHGASSRCLAALALLLAAADFASTAEPRKIATVEGITEYQLDNGLRLLLYPDLSRPITTLNMTVLVGSRHEGYGETGMAHLLEHMLFKGTWDQPNIPKALQDHGARFNASTTGDGTSYYEMFPASNENLDFFIRMEADRLVNSMVRKSDLDAEMTVVRNEFEAGENNPREVLMKHVEAAAYDFHNYGKNTIGNRSDIERVPIQNLQAFYRKYYQPDNVVLDIAGQFDEKLALEQVQKYFGAISKPERKLEATYTEEPEQDGERTVTVRRVGNVGLLRVVYHIPAGPHEDVATLQVLANILASTPTGRLYKGLVETQKAANAFALARADHDPSLFILLAEVRDPKQLEAARDELLSIAEKIGEDGVTDEEVHRAVKQILKNRELAAADTSQLAVDLGESVSQGDWRLYFLNRDQIENVTAAQVKAVAEKYLQRNNRTVGMFIPTEKPQRVPVPQTPDVKSLVKDYKGRQVVSHGEAFDPTSENIEARTQRNTIEGVKAALLPKQTHGEQVQLQLTLHYGDESSLKGLDTAADFLPVLMLHGTKKLSYEKLRDELDTLHATFKASGSTGSATFDVQATGSEFPAVLEILRQVLREPALPQEEFELLKREQLAELAFGRTEPRVLAKRSLEHELAPCAKDDVRYVPTIDEQIQRVEDTHYDQVVMLYREYLGAQAGELSIVGDFDSKTVIPILAETLSGWKGERPYSRIVMRVPSGLKGANNKINTPDKANAAYWAGVLFPVRDDDLNYPALAMADYILGANFLASRLGTRLRENEGLSYGVGSSLRVSSLDPRASFTLSAIANPQNITKVDTAIREELDRLLTNPPSQEELDGAKQGYLRLLKVRRADDAELASTLSNLSHAGRTMDYYSDLEQKIEALTPEQITAALKKYVQPKDLVIVSAGDFDNSAEK